MKTARPSALGSRAILLALLLIALACSFGLMTPAPAAAFTCPPGSYQGSAIIYYTDASRTTVACGDSCGDTNCDPTPYYKRTIACCYL